MLSPGVLHHALAALRSHRHPFVYTLGMHRGPKPQNESMLEDYDRSEEHTSELQSLMRISYAVFCLKKKTNNSPPTTQKHQQKHHTQHTTTYTTITHQP